MQAGCITGIVEGLLVFFLLAWLSYRWLLPLLGRWLPRRPRNLMLVCMMILFGFGSLSQYTGLGYDRRRHHCRGVDPSDIR